MSVYVWPHRWQPTRLPHPWDSPGKNTGVGCHFLLQCMNVKSYDQSKQHIKKPRHYFADKVRSSLSWFFSVVMCGYESWTIKKAERQRIDAFELWCWRRLLRVPWTTRRSNQWILEEINPAYSLEGLLLKLKLQYFGHLMQRTDSLEKTLMLGKIEARRRRWRQRTR